MTNEQTATWQDLLDLVTQLDQGSYETASVEFGGISVQLSKNGELPGVRQSPVSSTQSPATAASPEAQRAPEARPTDDAADSIPSSNTSDGRGEPIKAPMIGVFYRSPSPGAAPFVEEGDQVEADTTIGIIEVMKLMNPVTAGKAGRILSFDVADGEQVEYGHTLAVVDPGGQ